MLTTTRLQARPEGNQEGALCAVYMVAPKMQLTKTSAHSPPDTPLRGSGLPVIDQNRISSSRMPPQAISRNGQNREIMSTSGISGHRLRNKNRMPSPIRISGPITEPRLISRYLRAVRRLADRDNRRGTAAPASRSLVPKASAGQK